MIKLAGFEPSRVTSSGKEIHVSTTVRIQYRWLYRNMIPEYQSMRNESLNKIIGEDYARSSGDQNVVHMFKLSSSSIGFPRAFNFFIAVERQNTIYLLKLSQNWKSPKYTKTYGYTKKR